MKRFGIDDSIYSFKDLAAKAFRKHTAVELPLLGKFILAHHHGKYRTSGLENVLLDIFGHDHLFGAPAGEGLKSNLKVGVVATSSSRQTILLTNYNRPPLEQKSGRPMDIEKTEEEQEYNNMEENSPITDIPPAPVRRESGEIGGRPPFAGAHDSRTTLVDTVVVENIYTDLPEVDHRTTIERDAGQFSEVSQLHHPGDNYLTSHTESADSRKFSAPVDRVWVVFDVPQAVLIFFSGERIKQQS